ncbi:MAG: glycoside hydrolase family 78 protein [Oscillospiraceae bacterium]|jgi:alpha-L-rhamnosidase|nr:glycoside hydrolase family 78 protein [Oscillospiraceae bacterium]
MTKADIFGSAQWVTPTQACVAPIFRHVFHAESLPPEATLTVTGLGLFRASLNGLPVTDAPLLPPPVASEAADADYPVLQPAWTSYEHCAFRKDEEDNSIHSVQFLQYEVAPLLQVGENTLEIRVGPGWYKRYGYGGEAGNAPKCIYRLSVGDEEILSGETSEWSASHVTESKMLVGETHDYAIPAQWQPAAVTAYPTERYERQETPPDRAVRFLEPRLLRSGFAIPGSSDTALYDLYDCGENITGWVYAVHDLPAGETVTIRYAEEIDTPAWYPERGRGGRDPYGSNWRQKDTYISDGRHRVSHPAWVWQSFRYFAVSPNAKATQVAVIHADVPPAADFRCSNAVLNWYFEAFRRTQLCNMHLGIPSDCPQYEGCGYTGDGELAIEAATLTLDGRAFYKKWMQDIADGQTAKGRINYTAPFVPCGGGPGGWGCAIVHVPYVYWKTYGDAEPMAKYYNHMRRWFDYLELHSENDLVTSDEPGKWCLGDWCTADPDIVIPIPFVNTYFYIKSLKEIAEIAKAIGKEADIPAYEEAIARKSARLIKKYGNADGSFCQGVQGADAFAIDIGLGDARTLRNLVGHYHTTGQYNTGIFGTDILTRVLLDKGYSQMAYDLMTGDMPVSWQQLMQRGATTLWEYWDGTRSHSHPMFGACVTYLFRDFLGIRNRPGSVGFTDVVISPSLPDGLAFAEGFITNAKGQIKVSWKRSADSVRICVELPQGTSGVLRFRGVTYAVNGRLEVCV